MRDMRLPGRLTLRGGAAAAAGIVACLCIAPTRAFAETPRRTYNVGYRLLHVPQKGREPLVVALWYPTDAQPRLATYIPSLPHLEGKVALDAPPAKGPFPLVVFSHGGLGAGVVAMPWAEALAAAGFVVAGPDHADRSVCLRSDADRPPSIRQTLEAVQWAKGVSRAKEGGTISREEYEHRPREVRATIDALLQASADGHSPLRGLVDADRIGLTGVSFGAWTTLAVAGGIPAYRDERIKAAAPMAPPVGKSATDVAGIKVPLMIVFGQKETIILLDKRPNAPLKEDGVKDVYRQANPPKILVGIKGAEHLDFDSDGMTTRGFRRDDKVYSTARIRREDPVIRTIVRYQIAFWRRYLLGDRSAEEALTTLQEPAVYVLDAELDASPAE